MNKSQSHEGRRGLLSQRNLARLSATKRITPRAVEHDFLGAKDKLNEPVQVQDGDLEGKSVEIPREKTTEQLWYNVIIRIIMFLPLI